MAKEKVFNRTHYEQACRYLGKLRPGIFTPEMLQSGQDPVYEDFCLNALNSIRSHSDNDAFVTNYLNIFFHLYHMKKSAEKVYYVTPELSARLAQTSINIDSYFLKSPFREIYVEIDPGLFYINDIGGLKVPVHGFYVYLKDFKEYKQIRVMACSLMKPTEEIPFNDANFYFHVEVYPGKLNEQLKRHMKTKVEPELKDLKRFDLSNNIDYLEDFTAFTFNVLLYITSKKPKLTNYEPVNFSKRIEGLKSASKKRKLAQRAKKASTHNIIVIGEGIQDKNNDMENIQKAGGIGLWKLQNKVRVSGHWRTQWYGSEKDGTRRKDQIFIDDYEKGPEFADMVSSKFVVK